MRGVDYLQAVGELQHGMTLRLDAYEHQVFLDFRLLDDADGLWQQLYERLQGRAVADLDREMQQMRYQPLWNLFNALFDPGRLHVLAGALLATPQPTPVKSLIAQLNDELQGFAAALHSATGSAAPPPTRTVDLGRLLAGLTEWLTAQSTGKLPCSLLAEAWDGTRRQPGLGAPILSWVLLQSLGELIGVDGGTRCLQQLRQFGLDYAWQVSAASIDQERDIFLTMTLLETTDLSPHPANSEPAFASLCRDPANAGLLGINTHAGTTWFVEEGMASLAGAVALQAGIMPLIHQQTQGIAKGPATAIAGVLRQRLARAAAVGYRLDKFLRLG
jgi:hypothetical protein